MELEFTLDGDTFSLSLTTTLSFEDAVAMVRGYGRLVRNYQGHGDLPITQIAAAAVTAMKNKIEELQG